MIKNYLTIALRSMSRNKLYTLINILGLSVGMACCLTLALYVQDEIRFDRHHNDIDDLYQLTSIMGEPGENKVMGTTSAPIIWGIRDELPEIRQVARLVNPPGVTHNLITHGTDRFYESDGYIADSTVFDVFTYTFVEGNPAEALTHPNSVVLTTRLAKKIFGDEPALNKTISINQGGPEADFTVTGVVADQQASHIRANFFVSMTTSSGWAEYLRSPAVTNQWAGQNFMLSYLRLAPDTDIDAFQKKMNTVFLKYGADDLKTLGMKKSLGLQPVKDIYLYATYGDNKPRIVFIYAIASIAFFILLIACINFMNLSTAKATRRANEVGLRKTLGANRAALVRQFLGEAMLIVIFAVIAGLLFVQLILPFFNAFTGKEISLGAERMSFLSLSLVAVTVITGLVAGSYPAFYLSSFQPAGVMKNKAGQGSGANAFRKALVVVQFVIAITLTCCMVTVTRQLQYMQEQSLGFDRDNKLVLPLRSASVRKNFEALATKLSRLPAVNDVSGSAYAPGFNVLNDFTLYKEGSSMESGAMVKNCWVEPNYMDLMKIDLVSGRGFSSDRASESRNRIIINEVAAKKLGFEPDEITGQLVFNDYSQGTIAYEVIGVMKDFHQISLRDEIYPLLFRVPADPADNKFMLVDLSSAGFSETLSQVGDAWNAVNADVPFEYTFLDENIRRLYEEDRKVSGVITGFTVIAMIICALGLFGLSTYMAERRVKEIGIRKVLGASVANVATMMAGDYVRLVLISTALAIPFALYLIDQWLENFAYKTPVGAMTFVIAGAGALLIAVATVSFESLRAASGNPVDALRSE